MPEISSNKRIAKNTMFLYFRMILIMGVTIYTSRVVLDKLGVEDYGLYQVVGGVVGMLSFINGTLSIGSMRFLTYELGRKDEVKLHQTFCTAFYTHFALALILALILETAGLWFVYNKLVIPLERLNAAIIAYHISIFTSIFIITQVPYTSLIMAHERMSIYAYISIYEAVGKLLVVYFLSSSSFDRLIFYAILIAAVQISVAMFYRLYCRINFKESQLEPIFEKGIFRKIIGFSGWNIIANLSETLKLQGIIILINMFFSPVIVAAQAIANQVSGAMMQFVNNFRTAINPQIIKLYAAGDKEGSKRLTLETTIYCFDLILLFGLPAILVMDWIMDLWLVEVPQYAVIFTQWIIIRNIIGTFNAAFYVPMMAANKIKSNSFAALILSVGEFILLYFLLKMGLGPMWVQYMGVLLTTAFSLFVKPYILYREIDYSFRDLIGCYITCLKIVSLSLLLVLVSTYCLDKSICGNLLKIVLSALCVVIASYTFMDKETKVKLKQIVSNKFQKIKRYGN